MQNMLPSFSSFGAFLGLCIGFGVVIFVHELGHFLAAKWVGIKVTQFAIGFGHAIISYRKGLGLCLGSTQRKFQKRIALALTEDRDQAADGGEDAVDQQRIDATAKALGLGETEYRLNWMPLGGYVKMLGQDDLDPNARSHDPRSFNSKPIWSRACVISAGVVMNIIFGVVFFIICFMKGVEFPHAIVGAVNPEMPAATVYARGHEDDDRFRGLRAGDQIIRIDADPIHDFMDFAVAVALAKKDQTLNVTVKRGDDEFEFPIKPAIDKNSELLSVGVARPVSLQLNVDDTPRLPQLLRDAEVKPGMFVTEVDGQPVTQHHVFIEAMANSGGEPVSVTFAHPDHSEHITIDLKPSPGLQSTDDHVPHLFGLVPATTVLGVQQRSPAASAGIQTGDIFVQIDGIDGPTNVPQTIKNTHGRSFDIRVLRDGQMVDIRSIQTNSKNRIGVILGVAWQLPRVVRCLDASPTSDLELFNGSQILSINQKPVEDYGDMQRLLATAARANPDGGQIEIEYELAIRDHPHYTRTISYDADDAQRVMAAVWGKPEGLLFMDLRVLVKAHTALEAAAMGIKKTHQFLIQTYITLHRLIVEGTVRPSHLRGPLGILDEGTKVAQQGWAYLLFFLGLISVNLAVINFLPIPIVDGGLMFFLIVEKLKGSPVSARIQTAAFIVGIVLIGSIFLLTLYYDAGRILGG